MSSGQSESQIGPPQGRLELNPRRIVDIIDAAVITSTEVVGFHLAALADANLSEPTYLPEGKFQLHGGPLDRDQRRAVHENWILAKAFQELLRALRHALEVTHVFTKLLGTTHKVRSNTTVEEFLTTFEKKAAGLSFPKLLDEINEALTSELEFAACYKSLQSARNCLEHRGGIVGRPETHGKESFELTIPRMKIFYLRGDIEVELVPGHVIEPGDDRVEVDVTMKIEERKRRYKLGERLAFTAAEFDEIAFACHFLGQQIVSKLPNPGK